MRIHFFTTPFIVTGSLRLTGLFHLVPPAVHGRYDEESDRGRQEKTSDEGDSERPPERIRDEWHEAQDIRHRGEHDGAEAKRRRLDDGFIRRFSAFQMLPDLIQKDDAVADDHAGQRDEADDGNEADRLPRHEKGQYRTDETEWPGHDRHDELGNISQLEHQYHEDKEDHHRHGTYDVGH